MYKIPSSELPIDMAFAKQLNFVRQTPETCSPENILSSYHIAKYLQEKYAINCIAKDLWFVIAKFPAKDTHALNGNHDNAW